MTWNGAMGLTKQIPAGENQVQIPAGENQWKVVHTGNTVMLHLLILFYKNTASGS